LLSDELALAGGRVEDGCDEAVVDEFLAAFPDFELAPDEVVKWSVGQIRGPRELPVRINARTL
jgi:hypothetical protein